jgi:hypothetical protein
MAEPGRDGIEPESMWPTFRSTLTHVCHPNIARKLTISQPEEDLEKERRHLDFERPENVRNLQGFRVHQ